MRASTIVAWTIASVMWTSGLGSDAVPADAGSAPHFEARALRAYREPGTAVMSGSLSVLVAGVSKPLVASHAKVIAIPDCDYTRWWFGETVSELATQSGPIHDPAVDPALLPFERITYTDDSGFFRFAGLPAGAYRVRGRLDATFDRTVASEQRTGESDPGGAPLLRYSAQTFHDRSAFWLESGLVRLNAGSDVSITLHVAARRNVYGRRSR